MPGGVERTCYSSVFFFVFLLLLIVVDEIAISPVLPSFPRRPLVRIIAMRFRWRDESARPRSSDSHSGQTQDLAFFDFVFVDIDSAEHSGQRITAPTLRTVVRKVGVQGPCPPCAAYYIPRCMKSTPCVWRCFEQHRTCVEGPSNDPFQRIPRTASGWYRRRDYR